ncbi:deoxyribonuclease-2-beta isoform X2 [Sciurus carolinensis]|uniref:deoxyribonuclease-2-beta isoform X2 n=1 Tax=Sciurus carolinensis TaxID=30640 RepID=UPI001FB3C240|nr:deoxyribonuclease-2-beta isoform X2 [Sciurus carolinensis]
MKKVTLWIGRFIFYKLPKRQDKESGETGLQYLYLDSTIRSWRRSEQLMNTTESALGRTLQPLYEAYASKSNSTAYLIYNDGAPTSANYSRKYGHTKVCVTVVCGDACLLSSDSEGWNTEARESQVPGQPQQLSLLLWNRIQGFWLIHSIPRFPPIPEEGYNYPSTGRRNGQSGICITFKYNQYEAIDSQLLVCNPNVYSCSIPATFHQDLVHMPQLCARSSSLMTPDRHLATLQSAQGQNFLHFAKSDSFLDDIFAAWMAQELKIHLLTETWQRKRQELPSNCSLPYHVYNIKAIKISRQSYFGSYQDHAKWCISQKGTKTRWTCIGDLNRSPYQAFRSGGFICTQNRHIYQAFQRLVLYYEDCN